MLTGIYGDANGGSNKTKIGKRTRTKQHNTQKPMTFAQRKCLQLVPLIKL